MVTILVPDDPGVPWHDRIASGVRRAVIDGEVAAGELLPSARDLATSLDVHPNTVLRAYRDLRDEGLIELRRGRGATVRSGVKDAARLRDLADELVAEGRRVGVDRRELARMVDPELDRRELARMVDPELDRGP